MKKWTRVLCLFLLTPAHAEQASSATVTTTSATVATPSAAATTAGTGNEEAILNQITLLNQIPEDQLSDKADPGFSLLRVIYDKDAPDFLTLRKLVGQASIRAKLNPSVRCLLGNVISQRWDTYTLSGNLYLSGLKSTNPDLRDKARKKLICFIQPAHIPVLIDMLKMPGPNVLAYEILQEATGQRLDPTVKTWQAWWAREGSKMDLTDHLIQDTQLQLGAHQVHPFDQARFWYLPEGLKDAQTPYSHRPEDEQRKISDWNAWVNQDVKRFADECAQMKPVIDRIIHQPSPHVNRFLETLVTDPGVGDYASVVLAWRASADSLEAIRAAYAATPTVGRALARGSLGDKTALEDLLKMVEPHQNQPMSYKIMDDDARNLLNALRPVGVVSAEQAFELLCHTSFEFEAATTAKEKKKSFKKAKDWLKANAAKLALDPRRGFYSLSSKGK